MHCSVWTRSRACTSVAPEYNLYLLPWYQSEFWIHAQASLQRVDPNASCTTVTSVSVVWCAVMWRDVTRHICLEHNGVLDNARGTWTGLWSTHVFRTSWMPEAVRGANLLFCLLRVTLCNGGMYRGLTRCRDGWKRFCIAQLLVLSYVSLKPISFRSWISVRSFPPLLFSNNFLLSLRCLFIAFSPLSLFTVLLPLLNSVQCLLSGLRLEIQPTPRSRVYSSTSSRQRYETRRNRDICIGIAQK